MTQVDELYITYKEAREDVTKSTADKHRVLLDYLKRDFYQERFHHQVYLAIYVLGFTKEEAAKHIGCTIFEIEDSIDSSNRIIARWRTEQQQRYEDEQTLLQYPDEVEVNGEKFRIRSVTLSKNRKELQISLLDEQMYCNGVYFFFSNEGWMLSEFYGDEKSTYHGTKINDISLLEHPKVQSVIHQK